MSVKLKDIFCYPQAYYSNTLYYRIHLQSGQSQQCPLTDIYISANLIIPQACPDDRDRASLRNVGIWLNIDAADRPRKFYNIHTP
jgi:hypothetical protein